MPDFAWIISLDRQGFLGNAGVSSSYIVPKGEMNGLEGDLTSGKLWFIIRGQEDRCISIANVKRVERFSEGFHAGDFLIYPDLTQSIRLCSNYEEARRYPSSSAVPLNLGMSKLDDGIAESLKIKVSENIEVKFTAPSGLDGVPIKALPKNEIGMAIFVTSQIVGNLNLNRMWGSASGVRLNPVSNFAAAILSKIYSGGLSANLLNELKSINPIASVVATDDQSMLGTMPREIDRRARTVDISFTEIIPDNIYARDFIAGNSSNYDLAAALAKTDIAEKFHQLILRDVCEYLKSKGITSYESSSVDLMIDIGTRFKLFEIKSATITNLIAQAAKGAFQIAAYATAMKDDFGGLEAALIINKVDDEKLTRFVFDSLRYLNVDCLIYDPEATWPNRVIGLLD